jgi:hypothetical protein
MLIGDFKYRLFYHEYSYKKVITKRTAAGVLSTSNWGNHIGDILKKITPEVLRRII